MKLYATVYRNGVRIIDEIESENMKRFGREHLSFDDDRFTLVKNGYHYGTIYHGDQLFADKASCFAYWYQRTPRKEEERELVKTSLGATNI